MVVVAWIKKSKGGGGPMRGPMGAPMGAPMGPGPQVGTWGPMLVSTLTLGIDWRARRALQAKLAQLAQSGMTGTKEGRAMLLRETVLELRRAELSWLYVGYRDLGGHQPQQAEQQFRAASGEARARFKHEVVRAADGHVMAGQAPGVQARTTEGEGTVVVTLVVVARRPLRGVHNPRDASEIRAALDDRGSLTADQLVAMEVVWSPAVEDDRLSTSELEQFYPDLLKIDPTSIAGRTFCSYCSGPFPMELLTCPHCGAPVERQ
jgi:uncharacterized membrane protein